eukprot:comp20874_c0_seq1/m.43381 comp20874_c0_seq1/g.43381  ORF comp20874_c0_seq1/g.43381 comp20874_c0_seq1/m.43381 type:complete len:143 (+) comp20874_c0_seq1:300-728(+)
MTHLTLPAEATKTGVVKGGIGLKLIDTCAGICAYRHCKTNVVTASMEHTDLLSPVNVGELLKLRARVTFTSPRSMEINVIMEAESVIHSTIRLVATAQLVFVSLDANKKPIAVPQLTPTSELEKLLWEKGSANYERRRTKKS